MKSDKAKVRPVTKEQRKHLERRLLEERERITRSLARYEESTRDTMQEEAGNLSKVPFHMADEGTDTMQRELEASNATRESAELAEIDAALRRLYEEPERFGVCEDTGQPIPFARLDIVPWARTCGELSDTAGTP
jgi:RNA polymerase-binding transcription factor